MLVQCARRYYLRYYAGAGGWRENADADTRIAYCLRHLLTLELALGIELPGRLRVRLFRLDLATEETWEITAPDLEAAEARVQHSVAAMRCLLQRPEANIPEPMNAFPLTSSRGQCPVCPFWALCEDQLRNSGPLFKRDTSSLVMRPRELNS